MNKEAPSLVAKNMTIIGDMRGGGSIEIEGKIEGNIFADVVTLRETGEVKGTIKCKVFNIKGNFNGNVLSEKINISDTASINGVLEYNFLSVDYGANINCELKMVANQKNSGETRSEKIKVK
ncbi:MAG: polymer-forming cytoskeletal protein [Rickettsiales bacterium]|nr:polymer-forming cytoskeletal protein [Rickettsiales bacterium]